MPFVPAPAMVARVSMCICGGLVLVALQQNSSFIFFFSRGQHLQQRPWTWRETPPMQQQQVAHLRRPGISTSKQMQQGCPVPCRSGLTRKRNRNPADLMAAGPSVTCLHARMPHPAGHYLHRLSPITSTLSSPLNSLNTRALITSRYLLAATTTQ